MRRVVVTGLGLLSPFGLGYEHTWKQLLAGKSAVRRIDRFEVDDLPAKIASMVPFEGEAAFNADDFLEPKDQRKIADFILYGIAAADRALADSGWEPKTPDEQNTTGVLIGSGIGGIEGIAENALILKERGPRRISPFFIPGNIINLVSGQVSIRHGLKGPNHSVVTACSTGAHAIGDAARLIMWGDADVMLAGGSESPITRLSIAGFTACKALSTSFNDTPEKASRPYDRDRDGFVMAEGAAVLVLEELEHAKARGAKIYAEFTGYGLSGDAYHITAPAEDGDGAYRCMNAAIKRAGISPSDIDYINAHGTSTMADTIELGAVERVVGDAASKISMSSTKSSIGHMLGAAGAAEAIFSILAMRDNIAPPTINLDNPSAETAIDLVPNKPRERQIDVVLSNSFGFGGTNASLIFQRYDG